MILVMVRAHHLNKPESEFPSTKGKGNNNWKKKINLISALPLLELGLGQKVEDERDAWAEEVKDTNHLGDP